MFLEVLLQQVKQAASFLSVLKWATLKSIWIYSLSLSTVPRRSFPLLFQTKMYLHLVHIMYCTCCKMELCIWLTALNLSPAPEQLQLTQWWWPVLFMDLEWTLMLGLRHPNFHYMMVSLPFHYETVISIRIFVIHDLSNTWHFCFMYLKSCLVV